MHPAETIRSALSLASEGASAGQIARRLDLPRSTVRTWLARPPARLGERATCRVCGNDEHDYAGLPAAYVYLLGLYLGDGCVSVNPRGIFKLRIFLDARYPAIMDECERALRAVMSRNNVGRVTRAAGGYANSRSGGSVEMYSYSRSWPCLLPQHGPGRKHERPIVLADWQSALVDHDPGLLLRGLIHSDGCRFINTGTNWTNPRYSFSNRSSDIRGIFMDACGRLGVRWTQAPNTVYVSRKADVALLDEHVGPKR